MSRHLDKSEELELAWLVRELPDDLDKSSAVKIRQGYLPNDNPEIKDIRVREKNNRFTYTVKKFLKNSQETSLCSEETRNLSREEFEKLWKKAEKKTAKTRYFYSLEGELRAEIDMYENNLSGLVVVEIEFPSLETYKAFEPPEWFGKEVTDSKGIYPPAIAEMTIEEVNKINEEYVQAPHDFE